MLNSIRTLNPSKFKDVSKKVNEIANRHFHVFNPRKVLSSIVSHKDLKLLKQFVICKPDKGRAVVILNKTQYIKSVTESISNPSKFQQIFEPIEQFTTRIEDRINRFLLKLKKLDLISNDSYRKLLASGTGPVDSKLSEKHNFVSIAISGGSNHKLTGLIERLWHMSPDWFLVVKMHSSLPMINVGLYTHVVAISCPDPFFPLSFAWFSNCGFVDSGYSGGIVSTSSVGLYATDEPICAKLKTAKCPFVKGNYYTAEIPVSMSRFTEDTGKQEIQVVLADWNSNTLFLRPDLVVTGSVEDEVENEVETEVEDGDVVEDRDEKIVGPRGMDLDIGASSDFRTLFTRSQTSSVIDGGGLLHAVTWQPFSTFKQVINQYSSYATSNYGISSTVVFHGYSDGPSVKDHEHNRRIMTSSGYAHIQIEHYANVPSNQHGFLVNDENKSKLIDQLDSTLRTKINDVIRSNADADTYLLVTHAFSGCDKTSTIFDQEKTSIIKLVEKSEKARNFCDILMSSDSTVKEVGDAGIGLLVLMYSGRENDTLSHLRFVNYMRMTATLLKRLQPVKLPPTEQGSYLVSQFESLPPNLLLEVSER
ncbi:hypothetical protein GQR58_008624 [Nymphon striatum]|nr:hypothetical protein GQR58_008624 [Nymphon striatum]